MSGIAYEEGSVLQMVVNERGHLWATIEDTFHGINMRCQVLGWAIVVVSKSGPLILTDLQPVFLYNGQLSTAHDVGASHVTVASVFDGNDG